MEFGHIPLGILSELESALGGQSGWVSGRFHVALLTTRPLPLSAREQFPVF